MIPTAHLCTHGQNPRACLSCFNAPKAKPVAQVAPKSPFAATSAQSILDKVKRAGAPAPLPDVPTSAIPSAIPRTKAPENPHMTRSATAGEEPLWEPPAHRSVIDRQPRRRD